MTVKLPKAIEAYVNGANAGDLQLAGSSFSETAHVVDEGKTITGKQAIQAWLKETKTKYNHQTKPISVDNADDLTILRAEVSGTFKGSPVTLDYHFKIKDDLIEDLSIG